MSSYWDTLYYYLGYEIDYSPSDEDIKKRHEMLTQVKKSKLKLNNVDVIDKTKTLLNEKDCISLLHEMNEKNEKKLEEELEEVLEELENNTVFTEEEKEQEFSADDVKKFIEETYNEKKTFDIEEKKRKVQERINKRNT